MTTMQASWPKGRSRKPKTYDDKRVCATDECETRISRYNRSDFCFAHSPPKFPRVRGVVSSD